MTNIKIDEVEMKMNILRNILDSDNEIQHSKNRLSTLMLIAKNTDSNSVLDSHKKMIFPIVGENLKIKTILSEREQSYESLIDSLKLNDSDTAILKSFIPDLKWLIPVGGNLPEPLPGTKPNEKIITSWKEVVSILTIAISIGPAIQPFVDLKINNEEREQRKIENEFREKEIELDIIKTQQKERELNLKEGKINIPEKNIDIFY